ncbi:MULTISPECIES: hypothetical protein [Prochlorococcus]|nr:MULTISPECIES: hypothetical protein [Prochlorococcus]
MNYFFIAILSLVIFFTPQFANAKPLNKFDNYMNEWNQKISLASDYLETAEMELKNGDELQGCINQRKAANYGIEATQSLIKAFEISNSTEDLSDIKAGLNKWRELRDSC